MKRLQTKEWKEIRRLCLERDPSCRYPGCKNKSADVHHIIPHRECKKDELLNTVGLCKRHHNIADNLYFKYGKRRQDIIWLEKNKEEQHQ